MGDGERSLCLKVGGCRDPDGTNDTLHHTTGIFHSQNFLCGDRACDNIVLMKICVTLARMLLYNILFATV